MARILVKAIQNGEENLAIDIIQCGSYAESNNQNSKTIDTALLFCCSRGFMELANLLLDKGASVATTDKNLATPLHGAVDNGHLHVVRLLISHGANVNAKNYRGDTPLHLAAYRGLVEITQCLIKAEADCRVLNDNSFTAENEAFVHGNRDVGYFLRSEMSVRYPCMAEKDYNNVESMIQLDSPSVSVTTSSTTPHHETVEQQAKHYHQLQERQKEKKSDYTSKTESRDLDSNKFNDLFFISIDPPDDDLSVLSPSSEHTSFFNSKHIYGRTQSHLLDSANSNISYEKSQRTSSCTYQEQLEVQPNVASVFACSNVSQATYSAPANRHTFPSPKSRKAASYSGVSGRRPSTSSTSSCFSDFSLGTGSDPPSLFSTGSDTSINLCDYRREDVDFLDHDHKFKKDCSSCQDDEYLFLSLGVRNPPALKYTARYLTGLDVPSPHDFSDVYDSNLFSLSSLKSGSSMSLTSGPPSNSLDFTCSDAGKHCSNPCSSEFNRTSSNNSPSFSPQNLSITCSEDDQNNSSYLRSKYFQLDYSDNGLCPSLDSMPSNDLSSSCSLKKYPAPVTYINIPLDGEGTS